MPRYRFFLHTLSVLQQIYANLRGKTWEWTAERQAMRALLERFAQDKSAATAIEYGLIAAGISVAIIAVVNGLGTNLNNTFSSVNSQLR